jgi:hypothetical protein
VEAITQAACVKRNLLKYLSNFDQFRIGQAPDWPTFFAEGEFFCQRFPEVPLADR